jgi:hypothetical protein
MAISARQARLEADAKRKQSKRRQDLEFAESERRLHRNALRRARGQGYLGCFFSATFNGATRLQETLTEM